MTSVLRPSTKGVFKCSIFVYCDQKSCSEKYFLFFILLISIGLKMADNVDATYDVEGFQRRRLQPRTDQTQHHNIETESDVIVISSDDEHDSYTNQIKIEVEDNKANLSIEIFDPTALPTSIPNPSLNPSGIQRSSLTPKETTQQSNSHERFRTFAAKSTAHTFIPNATTQRILTSNQTQRTFIPYKTVQTLTTNRQSFTGQSFTPSERENVSAKLSTPESGFIDQVDQIEDYEIDNNQEQMQPSVLEHVQSPTKFPNIDPQTTEHITNLIHKAISEQFNIIPKKENEQQDENELLKEIRPRSSSSSSSTSMSGSESDSWKSNNQRSNRKRYSNVRLTKSESEKRRKQSNYSQEMSTSSESYRPTASDESDEDDHDNDDDDDLDSTFSKDTEPIADFNRSPQYEPEISGRFTFSQIYLNSVRIYFNQCSQFFDL